MRGIFLDEKVKIQCGNDRESKINGGRGRLLRLITDRSGPKTGESCGSGSREVGENVEFLADKDDYYTENEVLRTIRGVLGSFEKLYFGKFLE